MVQHTFETGEQVVAFYGPPLVAQRKTLVRSRAIQADEEIFPTETGELVGVKELDLAVVPCDGSTPYPCKITTFHQSWIETAPGSGLYRRRSLCRLVPIPEGHVVMVRSLEGELRMSHPDFIAIGIHGEVYGHTAEWVAANLEVLPEPEAA